MATGGRGPLNGSAFPAEPEDGTIEPDDTSGCLDTVLGGGLALLAALGALVVGVRIVLGCLGIW